MIPFFMVKYEDLVDDEKMLHIESTLSRLGFRGRALMIAMRCFWDLSLFGNLKADKVSHIQNKSMKVYGRDWDALTKKKYKEIFSEDAGKLGYEETIR